MAMKRCPVCGERYSDTYRACPFCEEEDALRRGDRTRRRSNGHRASRSEPGILSPVLIAAIVLLACVLVYLLFGDAIAKKLGRGDSSQTPGTSTSEPAVTPGATSGTASSGASSSGAASSGTSSSSGSQQPEQPAVPDTAVALSSADFTLDISKNHTTHTLTVSGGSGSYTWESSDDGIASVTGGVVTAISIGTATISVSDGYTQASCIVRVTGASSGGGTAASNAQLNKKDVSIGVGESFTLSVSGASGSVTFNVDNSSIISITDSGRVTGKAVGIANATATVDGKTLKCIVRVVR